MNRYYAETINLSKEGPLVFFNDAQAAIEQARQEGRQSAATAVRDCAKECMSQGEAREAEFLEELAKLIDGGAGAVALQAAADKARQEGLEQGRKEISTDWWSSGPRGRAIELERARQEGAAEERRRVVEWLKEKAGRYSGRGLWDALEAIEAGKHLNPARPSPCNPGKVCTHEGVCDKDCGGDHYYGERGLCLRCGESWPPTSATQEIKSYAAVLGGGLHCQNGELHRPSLSQSGGILRCSRCGAHLRQEPLTPTPP